MTTPIRPEEDPYDGVILPDVPKYDPKCSRCGKSIDPDGDMGICIVCWIDEVGTPYDRHRAHAHAYTVYSRDGIHKIEECASCGLSWILPSIGDAPGTQPITVYPEVRP